MYGSETKLTDSSTWSCNTDVDNVPQLLPATGAADPAAGRAGPGGREQQRAAGLRVGPLGALPGQVSHQQRQRAAREQLPQPQQETLLWPAGPAHSSAGWGLMLPGPGLLEVWNYTVQFIALLLLMMK